MFHHAHADLEYRSGISFAWASYTANSRGRNSATLKFTFNPPLLNFVCDHDALLTINIKSVQKKDER